MNGFAPGETNGIPDGSTAFRDHALDIERVLRHLRIIGTSPISALSAALRAATAGGNVDNLGLLGMPSSSGRVASQQNDTVDV